MCLRFCDRRCRHTAKNTNSITPTITATAMPMSMPVFTLRVCFVSNTERNREAHVFVDEVAGEGVGPIMAAPVELGFGLVPVVPV